MQRVLLDTDILSEILKRKDPAVMAQAAKYAAIHLRFTFTAVSVHEIIYGLESKAASQQLVEARRAFAANEIVVPTLEDYDTAGHIRGAARRQGQQLALDDCLICAVATRLGLPVVTGNWAHFQAAQAVGLLCTLENWRSP
jgi:predicted nucleic acid-binding protein